MGRGRIVAAMSGGVDSSVVASLLLEEGWEVIGVTLQLRPCDDRMASRSCCNADAIIQARAVAGKLGIPHYVVDCQAEFSEKVLRPAWEEYNRGRTPSPCLHCNKEIKFGFLGDYARRLGASAVATGHYARLFHDGPAPVLMRGVDRAKDQSYFLSALGLEQLRSIRLPLGSYTKPQVRELAKALELPTAERHESQDACLSYEGMNFPDSLRFRFDGPVRLGPFVDPSGKVLGQHDGFHRYTIGQRRGLKIALGARAHVVGLRAEDAAVILSLDDADVCSQVLRASGVHWYSEAPSRCQVQIRSRHQAAWATIRPLAEGALEIQFDEAQNAITPGQALAFFDQDRVLGGGWIEAVLH